MPAPNISISKRQQFHGASGTLQLARHVLGVVSCRVVSCVQKSVSFYLETRAIFFNFLSPSSFNMLEREFSPLSIFSEKIRG